MATFHEMWPDWEMGVKRMPGHALRGYCIRIDKRRTLQTNLVALQGVHGLLEEGLTGGRHARDVVLLPLNGGVDIVEDLLHRLANLSTNTVSRDKGDLYGKSRRWLRNGGDVEDVQCEFHRTWCQAG